MAARRFFPLGWYLTSCRAAHQLSFNPKERMPEIGSSSRPQSVPFLIGDGLRSFGVDLGSGHHNHIVAAEVIRCHLLQP